MENQISNKEATRILKKAFSRKLEIGTVVEVKHWLNDDDYMTRFHVMTQLADQTFTTYEITIEREFGFHACTVLDESFTSQEEAILALPTVLLHCLKTNTVNRVNEKQGVELVNEQDCGNGWQPYNLSDWRDGLAGLYKIIGGKREHAEFHDLYSGDPDFNYENEEGQEGFMETFEPHVSRVQKVLQETPEKVWTIFDSDEGMEICAGYHLANRVLYFISNEKWENENECYSW